MKTLLLIIKFLFNSIEEKPIEESLFKEGYRVEIPEKYLQAIPNHSLIKLGSIKHLPDGFATAEIKIP